jgi:hypothetical protein
LSGIATSRPLIGNCASKGSMQCGSTVICNREDTPSRPCSSRRRYPRPLAWGRRLRSLGSSKGLRAEVHHDPASVKPTMHGTYLWQSGCADSILVVLPEEIPHYDGSERLVKDAGLDAFLQARFNYHPDAPGFDATFFGQLEYSAKAKFGLWLSQTRSECSQRQKSSALRSSTHGGVEEG